MKPAPTALIVPALMLFGASCVEEGARAREPLPLVASDVGPLAAQSLRALAARFDEATGWLDDARFVGWLAEAAASATDAAAAPEVGDGPTSTDPPEATEPSWSERAEDLADRLEREVLVPSNLLRDDLGTLVFVVPVAALCPTDGDAPADQACVERFSETALALRVASFVPGELELTLLVGAGEIEAATLTLGPTRLALELDAARALEAMVELGGAALPIPERAHDLGLRAASGRLRLALDARGGGASLPAVIEATFTVSSPLDIDGELGGHPVAATLARTTLSAELDPNRRRIVLTSDVGALAARLPYQLVADLAAGDDEAPARVAGDLSLDLAGQSATATLDEATGELRVDRLGLGPRASRLTLSGETVVGVDLRAGRGREVSLVAREAGDDEGVSITLGSGVELVVELGLGALVDVAPELATSWAAAETLGVALDAAVSPAVLIGDALRVTAGRLALVSTARPELSLEVRAGQCLVTGEPGEEETDKSTDEHPLAHLRAGSCEGP